MKKFCYFCNKFKKNNAMKKNFLIFLAVVVSVVSAVFVFTPKSDAERLLDANVKALAESVGVEVGISSGRTQCFNEYKLCSTDSEDNFPP